MKQRYKISSLVITNGEREGLERALKSILDQTIYCEILVVYENNTNFLKRLRKEYSQAKFIRSDTIGNPNAHWKLGVSHASGEYVAFLDDDDYWKPTYLQSCNNLTELDPDIIAHGMISLKGSIESDDYLPPKLLNREILLTMNPGIRTSNLCIKKKFYEAAGGHDLDAPGSTDRIFLIKALEFNPKISISNDRLVVYQKGQNSMTNGQHRKNGFLYLHRNYGVPDNEFLRTYTNRRIYRFFGVDLETGSDEFMELWWEHYLIAEKNPEIREDIYCETLNNFVRAINSNLVGIQGFEELSELSRFHEELISSYHEIDTRKNIVISSIIYNDINNIQRLIGSLRSHIQFYGLPVQKFKIQFFISNPKFQNIPADDLLGDIEGLEVNIISHQLFISSSYEHYEIEDLNSFDLSLNRDRLHSYLLENWGNRTIQIVIDEDKRFNQLTSLDGKIVETPILPILSHLNYIHKKDPKLVQGLGLESGSPPLPISSFILNQLADYSDSRQINFVSKEELMKIEDYYYDLGVSGYMDQVKVTPEVEFCLNDFKNGIHLSRPLVHRMRLLEETRYRSVKGGIAVIFRKEGLLAPTLAVRINGKMHRRGDTMQVLISKAFMNSEVKEISFTMFHNRATNNQTPLIGEIQKMKSDLFGYCLYKSLELQIEKFEKLGIGHLSPWFIEKKDFRNIFNTRKTALSNALEKSKEYLVNLNLEEEKRIELKNFIDLHLNSINQINANEFPFNQYLGRLNHWVMSKYVPYSFEFEGHIGNLIEPWLISRILPHLQNTDRILDWGCGEARVLTVLNKLGYDCFGYDPDPSQTNKARNLRNLLELNYPLTSTKQNVRGSFDIIINSLVSCVIDSDNGFYHMIHNLTKHARKEAGLFFITCHPKIGDCRDTGYWRVDSLRRSKTEHVIKKKNSEMKKYRIDVLRSEVYISEVLADLGWVIDSIQEFKIGSLQIPHFMLIYAKFGGILIE